MRLAGKSIVVTGASGIAAAGARMFSSEGADVFIVSIDENECRRLVSDIESLGGRAAHATADLTVEEEAASAFEEAVGFLGRIDGVFAVAGGSGRPFGDGPAHDTDLTGWARTFEVNTYPMFLSVSNGIRGMLEGGSVVVVSSVLATSPSPELFATHSYSAAKGAANAFVTSLASYYARDAIRVNGIAPGLVRTPMSERAASDPETVAYAESKQPLARGFLDPEDVAHLAVFLLSDESAQITGQVIAVDGGWSVTEA